MEIDMLKALLLGTALTFAVAIPSIAQNAPGATGQPGTTQPGTIQPGTLPRPTTPPAAQPTTPPTQAQPTQAQTSTPATVASSHLIGLTLRNSANESIGDIDDVLVDADGRVRQVIVGVGGFLGMGEHKVAIAWDQLRFDRAHDVATVSFTKDQVRAMPEYRPAPVTRP
jgi:hypothetical protein